MLVTKMLFLLEFARRNIFNHISTMGDSSRSVTSICGPCEYITPIGVRVPHNPLSSLDFRAEKFRQVP
jgi:hypothetical protein